MDFSDREGDLIAVLRARDERLPELVTGLEAVEGLVRLQDIPEQDTLVVARCRPLRGLEGHVAFGDGQARQGLRREPDRIGSDTDDLDRGLLRA